MATNEILFFFNDTATTEIYTLSLHDALPISPARRLPGRRGATGRGSDGAAVRAQPRQPGGEPARALARRSEEHTSELQSRQYLVCSLLLEKKKNLVSCLLLAKKTNHTSIAIS